tara:strand:+ start:800 stop:931 length:132 start_codon:yes stop_codon:yes gene_type:complete
MKGRDSAASGLAIQPTPIYVKRNGVTGKIPVTGTLTVGERYAL